MSLRGFKEKDFRTEQKILTPTLYVKYANEIAKVSPYALTSGMRHKEFKYVAFNNIHELEYHLINGWTAWVAVSHSAYPDGHYVTANSVISIKDKNQRTVKLINSDDPKNKGNSYYTLDSVSIKKSWAITV